MDTACHIVMIAAENDALPNAKVGGIGDVVRDLPDALAVAGCQVSVLMPAYGRLHRLPGATATARLEVAYRGGLEPVSVWQIPDAYEHDMARCFVLDHPLFERCGTDESVGAIYCNDAPHEPFATDASKFALFSAASASLMRDGSLGDIQVIHLHDWHSALVAVLRGLSPAYSALRKFRCVYSIHNLALQGVRPFDHHPSSLAHWFPELAYAPVQLADPRWPDCINPMAAGIRLSDAVHAVSPAYAEEIQQPNDPARGFHGGEGLEADLTQAAAEERLVGIINAIPESDQQFARLTAPEFAQRATNTILQWVSTRSAHVRPADLLALERARQWASRPAPQHLLTSVGRMTAQKLAILMSSTATVESDESTTAASCLEQLLRLLARHDAALCLLGSGEPELERRCLELAGRHDNFLFLNGYGQGLAEILYASGDLFLMPSSFEPCGISQMLAMRAGQACLVHATGGLRDTVSNDVDGFAFEGDSLPAQARALLSRAEEILKLRETAPRDAAAIARAASQRPFRWADSVPRYIDELYRA